MKILIVDDEPEITESIKPILELKGYAVISAQTGQDALNIYPKENPDIVLLDLGLPDIDGREVKNTTRAHIPRSRPFFKQAGYAE